MYYAAGVLIVSWYNGRLYTLLGKDHYNTFSDFGGKCDPCDTNFKVNTAAREMYEETSGCLLSIDDIKFQLKSAEFVKSLSYTNTFH